MFDTRPDAEVHYAGAPVDEDWFESAWLEQVSEPDPEDIGQVPASVCAPSGWLALELDNATAVPVRLSDADLIDAIVGFERVVSWAGARQAGLLAEFARRRPESYSQPTRSDTPSRCSKYASDEVGLALRLSRSAALDRLMMAQELATDLPATLAAWEAGTLDVLKVRAITDAGSVLTGEQCAVLEARVLPRAGTQTRSQLRAALTRAVLAIDPDGAAARHQQRRKDRRVVVGPDETGMATLWALLSAPDATAAYQRLCRLARGLGAEDPRGMDARRADLLVDLLTGRRCAVTGACDGTDCDGDCDNSDDGEGFDDDGGEGDGGETAPADTCPATEDTATASPATESSPTEDAAIDDAATGHAETQDATSGNAATETAAPDSTHARSETRPASPADPAAHDRTGRGRHRCGPARGASKPGKPLISVIVPITTLMGLDELPAELVGYGPIPAALAREIAADGTWRRLLTDPTTGTLLDYGRTTYTPPAALADFVRARDLYCRNPICRQPAATADLDHTLAWDDGGTTSEHNLYAGCRHDHRLKTHAPDWHVHQHPDGRVTWTTPTGHTYTSHPHDYRPDPQHRADSSGNTDAPGNIASAAPGHDPPDPDPPPF